jgi:hypothetical protein
VICIGQVSNACPVIVSCTTHELEYWNLSMHLGVVEVSRRKVAVRTLIGLAAVSLAHGRIRSKAICALRWKR